MSIFLFFLHPPTGRQRTERPRSPRNGHHPVESVLHAGGRLDGGDRLSRHENLDLGTARLGTEPLRPKVLRHGLVPAFSISGRGE